MDLYRLNIIKNEFNRHCLTDSGGYFFYIIYGNYGQIKLKIHYICNNKCLLTKNNKRKKGDMTLEELVRQT